MIKVRKVKTGWIPAASSSESSPLFPRVSADWDVSVFVGGVWCLMLLCALTFANKYGSSVVPHSDEWAWIPVASGEEPLTLGWLWSQHADHRMFLGRFVWLTWFRLTGGDLRIGMYFNALMLGGLALAFIFFAKRLRGRLHYSDAFFPLGLLNLGQWSVFTNSQHIVHILPAVLVAALLMIIIDGRSGLTLKQAALAGTCMLLLPLCDASGLPYVVALSLWLGYAGVLQWCSPAAKNKHNALVTLSLVLGSLSMLAFHFIGYQKAPHPLNPGLRACLRFSIQFLGMSLGPGTAPVWRSLGGAVLGLLIIGLLMISVLILLRSWHKWPQEHLGIFGLFLFIATVCGLALCVGWGRACYGEAAAFCPHYVLFAFPALCCAYFVSGVYGSAGSSRFMQMSLFALTCIFLAQNVQVALEAGWKHHDRMEAFEKDLMSGTPPFVLAERYSRFLYPYLPEGRFWVMMPDEAMEQNEYLASCFRMLHRRGIGKFRFLRDDPIFREVSLTPIAPNVKHMVWDQKTQTGYPTGHTPSMSFRLSEPRFLYALRLRYSYEANGPTSASFRMWWRNNGRNDFSETERNAGLILQNFDTYASTRAGEKTVTIWLNDTIDEFRFEPDTKACVFRVSTINLIVPPA